MKNIAIKPEDYTILAVDDIATNIMLLKAVLSRAKYKIVTASGGFEALEKVAEVNPDLILLDIMMPDLDGYEVLKRLKADPAHEDIPVIFLTALHNPEDIVKGFKFGASDYISKPFNHEELITRVAHHIYLAAAQRTILQQRDELQATVEARDKMYSVIAHDLRSPIGTLKMVFNMLSINLTADQIGEDSFEMISMGNNITESTFMLLDNLLKWTKSQIGRMNTVFQEVDISEVVLFASKMSDVVAQVKNIEVEYEIPGPITVSCDVDMVKTIMRNLMSNAIKYSQEGGKIVVAVSETPTHAAISVRDNGIGIKEEDIPKLLNPETHYTTYGTKNEEGSGLGLQLVQDLTHRNGGSLTIESKEGEGSTFTFTIAKEQPKQEPGKDEATA
ncbi:hybrid sensor histidine kinase/response regulator [Alistipes provencensis]|uniref:hybrid sensor histidine kinase/response regulator n=1 Tax=Alistipes provencensis TaxID=1816676 RepID=UPI0007ECBE07|nr:hybrid sensor histidine kinase/response regulator [Alistipes provencensis]